MDLGKLSVRYGLVPVHDPCLVRYDADAIKNL